MPLIKEGTPNHALKNELQRVIQAFRAALRDSYATSEAEEIALETEAQRLAEERRLKHAAAQQ